MVANSSPNEVSLPSGIGRNRSSTGNRIDRAAENLWMTAQDFALPYGPAAGCLSLLQTALLRCVVYLGPLLLLTYYKAVPLWVGCWGLALYAAHSIWLISPVWGQRPDLRPAIIARALLIGAAVFYVDAAMFWGLL